jgi:hypothetical protein
MNARIANTIPRKTPFQCPTAWFGLNGPSVRSPAFESSIHTASAPKIAISKAPRITPAVVESRMSRYVRRNTMIAISVTQIHHWPV